MKIAICDDEKEYRQLILKHIKFYFTENYINAECLEYCSAEDLLNSNKKFDIIFLDIEMGKINGIQAAKAINKTNRNALIFIITAHQKYLDDAMDLKIFRYLSKPLQSKRIYDGLDKAIEFINNNDISFKTREYGIVTMNKSDIIYVEVFGKRVYVTGIKEIYTSREKMNFFRKNLNASYFASPHNSFIVNFNYITGIKKDSLKLKNNRIIPISVKKKNEFKKKFMWFIGENYGNLSDNF